MEVAYSVGVSNRFASLMAEDDDPGDQIIRQANVPEKVEKDKKKDAKGGKQKQKDNREKSQQARKSVQDSAKRERCLASCICLFSRVGWTQLRPSFCVCLLGSGIHVDTPPVSMVVVRLRYVLPVCPPNATSGTSNQYVAVLLVNNYCLKLFPYLSCLGGPVGRVLD